MSRFPPSLLLALLPLCGSCGSFGLQFDDQGWLRLLPTESGGGTATHASRCQIVAVEGDFLAPKGGATLTLKYRAASGSQLRPDTLPQHGPQEHRIVLCPPPRGSWLRLPGAELLQPRSFGLVSMDLAPWFTIDGASATLRFRGSCDPSACGRLLPASQAPAAWAGLAPMAEPLRGALASILRAQRRHDWPRLLGGPERLRDFPSWPLALLDDQGRVRDPDPVVLSLETQHLEPRRRQLIAETHLLLRLESPRGELWFLRIPLGLLMHDRELDLRRAGPRIRFERRQTWESTAASPRSAARDPEGIWLRSKRSLAVQDLRLEGREFRYLLHDRDAGRPILVAFLETFGLAPIQVAVETLIRTAWFYPALRQLLHGGNRPWAGPGSTRK